MGSQVVDRSARYAFQSRAARRVQFKAAVRLIPKVSLSTEAGRSPASARRAVLRAVMAGRPCWWSLRLRVAAERCARRVAGEDPFARGVAASDGRLPASAACLTAQQFVYAGGQGHSVLSEDQTRLAATGEGTAGKGDDPRDRGPVEQHHSSGCSHVQREAVVFQAAPELCPVVRVVPPDVGFVVWSFQGRRVLG